jgi:hypothetical protein
MRHEERWDHVMTKGNAPGSTEPDTEPDGQPDPDITRNPDGTPKENPSGATTREEEADTASGGPADPPD